MKPTIGRIVHYTPRVQQQREKSERPRAAIIVDVIEEQGFGPGSCEENAVGVYLAVCERGGMTFPGAVVRFHPEGALGTWRWPPRDPPATQPLLPSS